VPVPLTSPQVPEVQGKMTAAAVTDNQAADAAHHVEKDLIWAMIHD
jgi:hypothetical protein